MSCKDKDKAGNIKILHTGFYAGHNTVYTLYAHNRRALPALFVSCMLQFDAKPVKNI